MKGWGPHVSQGEVQAGLGRAGWEAKARKEWGEELAGRRPRPRRLGRNLRRIIQEIKHFRILFGIRIFGKVWKFAQGDLEGILT
jgi:hypothetical protein